MRTQTQDGLLGEGVGDWRQSELIDTLLFPHSHRNKSMHIFTGFSPGG